MIFLSGCAMRCQFCHNPDTWNMTDGKEYTTDQLLKTALRFKSYWGDKGGITVSGGEPLLQMDFLTELFRKAKEAGVHTLSLIHIFNASGVIRECEEGRGVEVPGGLKGVWLDTPMIEILGGEGTIEKRIPAMFRMYMNYGVDMRKVPIVIYPTLHYQNGGLEIDGDGFTKEIPNLLVAGEAAGGIHGRNRLMGNSLLDVIVFGRNAGKKAAAKCKEVEMCIRDSTMMSAAWIPPSAIMVLASPIRSLVTIMM